MVYSLEGVGRGSGGDQEGVRRGSCSVVVYSFSTQTALGTNIRRSVFLLLYSIYEPFKE
jgi:hypothetical protein